jgi:predicted Fe-S protein YdhL (DUF1289 family)
MGVSLSFLAIKGAAPADVHRALGVSDTGVASSEDDYPIPPVRGAELSPSWYLVLLDHVVHRLIKSRAIITRLSRGCEVIACQIEEHDMYSGCFGLRDGEFVWSVVHDSRKSHDHLGVWGELPAALDEIEARILKTQEEERRVQSSVEVDHIMDIPLELAASFCGYRHSARADWGEPAFTVLAESKAPRRRDAERQASP